MPALIPTSLQLQQDSPDVPEQAEATGLGGLGDPKGVGSMGS